MSFIPTPRAGRLFAALFMVLLLTLPGCYRKEISRRGYTGFQVESGAEPAPRAQPHNFPGYKPPVQEKSDPLGDLFSPVTGLFRAIGGAFQGDAQQQGNYTPPQPDGLPHRPKAESTKENISLFPPDDPLQGQ